MAKNPNVVELTTMTALEVVVERVLTFDKSVRQMPSGKRRWMWAGATRCTFDQQECSWFNLCDTCRTV